MVYILASEYNKRLYNHISSRGLLIEYVNSLEYLLLDNKDTVITDGHSHGPDCSIFHTDKTFRHICMSDSTRTEGESVYISKYQPIKAICTAIFERENMLVTVIGGGILFEKIQFNHPNCICIDFSYNPESELSLIQILDKSEAELLKIMETTKRKILYPITNVMDVLNPPIKLIKPMIDTLKKTRDTIVHIDHLKGPMDLMILKQSDMIIIVHEKIGNNKCFDAAIEHIASPKKMISLNISSRAYEQFELSDHMLCVKEF